nr:hypothetical protein [Tanacetum cinerariifolium]
IRALIDRKKIIVNEASIRRDLKLEDAEGIACLPNDTIFEELARMSAKTTAWNEFSSIMASAIICLATNQKFNFSKYILDNMEAASKRGRIAEIDVDEDISLINETAQGRGRMNEEEMFGVDDLDGNGLTMDVT